MSLNKLTSIDRGKKADLKIGCIELNADNITCTNNISSTHVTTTGDLIVTTDDSKQVNLSTPDQGSSGYTLHTDGIGNTYWAPSGGGGGGGIVYNGPPPTEVNQLSLFSNTSGSAVKQSLIKDDGTSLNLNNEDLTNVKNIEQNGYIQTSQITTPTNASAGSIRLFSKTGDDFLHVINSTGVEQTLDLSKIENITLSTQSPDVTKFSGIVESDNVYSNGFVNLLQISTPSNPVVGDNRLYVKSDGKLYLLNSSGVESEVGAGSGATPLDWDIIPSSISDIEVVPNSYDYYINEQVPYDMNISGIRVSLTNTGSDPTRVAIYRGNDTTATLVAQSAQILAASLTTPWYEYSLTAESGQNLSFVKGEKLVIALAVGGITTTFRGITVNPDIDLAWSNTTDSRAGFPTNPRAKGIATPRVFCCRLIAI